MERDEHISLRRLQVFHQRFFAVDRRTTADALAMKLGLA